MKEEYTVEIYKNESWIEQVDIFSTYEEAEEFTKNYPLKDENYSYSIWCIEYDENENEIESYPIY